MLDPERRRARRWLVPMTRADWNLFWHTGQLVGTLPVPSPISIEAFIPRLTNPDYSGKIARNRAVWEAKLMKFANRALPILVLVLLSGVLLLHAGCASTGYNGGGKGGSGTTVPPTPMGFTAVAGNAQVALNWTASSNATGYYVKRSTTTDGPYTQIATQTATTDTDTGLTNGTKYFYVVSAYNSAGQSANSTEVNATPVLPPPAAPLGLAATPGNAQVSLTWTASASASSYHVRRSMTSGAETQISAPTSTNFTDTGLTNGTKYFYDVSAVNSGGESANSPEVSAT